MTTVHEVAIRTAANRWYDADNEEADIATGLANVAALVKAVAPLHGEQPYWQVLKAAGALLRVYVDFVGDLDGEATQELVVALTQAGFPPPEPVVPLTDAERSEVWESWQEVFRDDPSDAVEMLTQEWTDRDWRVEHDDMFHVTSGQ